MKGMNTSPLQSVNCPTEHTQPKGNQVAIKYPVRKLANIFSQCEISHFLSHSEVAFHEYFLNYLTGNTKE